MCFPKILKFWKSPFLLLNLSIYFILVIVLTHLSQQYAHENEKLTIPFKVSPDSTLFFFYKSRKNNKDLLRVITIRTRIISFFKVLALGSRTKDTKKQGNVMLLGTKDSWGGSSLDLFWCSLHPKIWRMKKI